MLIKDIYELYKSHSAIVTDTRKIVNNSIFFALKGGNFNGNLFAKEALKKGANYAIVDEDISEDSKRIIKVKNVLETLQELAKHHRETLNIPVIGITGTNGKTTNKELLNTVLASKYKVLATKGNLNNHIGVPLTILEIDQSYEIAIIEMGANHLGEISDLCDISQPTIGLVTNTGIAHLEGFGSYENIIKTKAALYEYVTKHNGINFSLKENTDILTYLSNKDNFKFFSCKDIKTNTFGYGKNNGTQLDFIIKRLENKKISDEIISTKLVGIYNETNILTAITIGDYFKIDLISIKKTLENYQPTNNRSQLQNTNRNTLILDAYNANPSSVPNAIRNISESQHSNKIIILGDMFELGEFSKEKHTEIVELLEKESFNRVILIGNAYYNCKQNKRFENYRTLKDFIEFGELRNINKALILIKGSRGMQMEELVKYL